MRFSHICSREPALVSGVSCSYLYTIEVKKERGNIMFDQLRKIARAVRIPSIAEREMAYLNGSRDRIDLEYRQRQIDSGLFRKGL